MKYALIPVLDKLNAWMKVHKYEHLTLDEFLDALHRRVRDLKEEPISDECAEWLWEIYHANN